MNRILIIGPSWVGDMVMSQSLFRLLRQNDPDCVIDVLAPAWSLPILARMPEVRRGMVLPFGHGELKLGERYRFGKQLRGEYDQAIILPNSLKSALIPFHAAIPKRTGWTGEMRHLLLNDVRILDEIALPRMVQRFAALALPKQFPLPTMLPKPQLTTTAESAQAVQRKYGLDQQLKALALCPGAEFGTAKQWPEAHYAAAANAKIRDGWQVWILGSRNDSKTAETIFSLIHKPKQKSCINLVSRTELVETIDVLALADAVISNDSGLMHIAAAVNTPLVAIYGSTSPEFTPPLSDKVAIVKSDIECAPCFDRTCRYGHRKCMTEQLPVKILTALDGLMNAWQGQPRNYRELN